MQLTGVLLMNYFRHVSAMLVSDTAADTVISSSLAGEIWPARANLLPQFQLPINFSRFKNSF